MVSQWIVPPSYAVSHEQTVYHDQLQPDKIYTTSTTDRYAMYQSEIFEMHTYLQAAAIINAGPGC